MSIKTTTPQETYQRLNGGSAAVLIDVRTPREYASVHAAGAVPIPLHAIAPGRVRELCGEVAGKTLYLICRSGARSEQAARKLAAAGLADVVSVAGGTLAWQRAGLPVEGDGRRALPLDRQVQLTAGLMALIGGLLGFFVNYWFFVVPTFVGFGMTLAGATGLCPMALGLAKMPWNRNANLGASCCAAGARP